jgi:hypothetical protein
MRFGPLPASRATASGHPIASVRPATGTNPVRSNSRAQIRSSAIERFPSPILLDCTPSLAIAHHNALPLA